MSDNVSGTKETENNDAWVLGYKERGKDGSNKQQQPFTFIKWNEIVTVVTP